MESSTFTSSRGSPAVRWRVKCDFCKLLLNPATQESICLLIQQKLFIYMQMQNMVECLHFILYILKSLVIYVSDNYIYIYIYYKKKKVYYTHTRHGTITGFKVYRGLEKSRFENHKKVSVIPFLRYAQFYYVSSKTERAGLPRLCAEERTSHTAAPPPLVQAVSRG